MFNVNNTNNKFNFFNPNFVLLRKKVFAFFVTHYMHNVYVNINMNLWERI